MNKLIAALALLASLIAANARAAVPAVPDEGDISEGATSATVCETDKGASEYLESWLKSASGVKHCNRYKACKNCCGEDNRFDKFYAKCAKPMELDPKTLGNKSDIVCEDEGLDYLAGFLKAKTDGKIANCNLVKSCGNCCGAGEGLDKFYVECKEEKKSATKK